MWASVGVGPVRVGGRIGGKRGKRKPFEPVNPWVMFTFCMVMSALFIAGGLGWGAAVFVTVCMMARNWIALTNQAG